MRKTAPPQEPTFEQRLSRAQLYAADARDRFLSAAFALEQQANDLDELAQDTQNEIDRLVDILTAAVEDSDANRASARNLRALVSPDQLTLF